MNIQFLLQRQPIEIPPGILPDQFVPQEGSVYRPFSPGLPPVVVYQGQYYPLSDEEFNYIISQAAGETSGGGPESMPQMPSPQPEIPKQPEVEPGFEQQVEQQPERAVETGAEQATERSSANDNVTNVAATASSSPPQPQAIVDVDTVFARGKDLFGQSVLDSSYHKYQQGKLNPPAKPTEDAANWLQLVFKKAFSMLTLNSEESTQN